MQTKIKWLGVTAAFATAASLIAGGIVIELAKPSSNPEAQAKHALLVVRAYACTAPEKTTITATAEGLIRGKRESIPLKLIPLSGESMYAVTRQWPADGDWVLSLVEANPNFDRQPSLIVKVNGDSVDWAGVMRLSHPPDTHEIEAALNTVFARKMP